MRFDKVIPKMKGCKFFLPHSVEWCRYSDGEKILKIYLFVSTEFTDVIDGLTDGDRMTHRPKMSQSTECREVLLSAPPGEDLLCVTRHCVGSGFFC